MRRGRPPCRAPTSRSPAIPTSRGSCRSRSSHPSRAMGSGSTGWPGHGSLTTRLRSQRCASRRRFAMTSADRRARTSRGGRPAPRAKCPSGRCAGRGRAGRHRAHVVGALSRMTLDLPAPARQQVVQRAYVPVSQFHGRSGLSHPIHSPPPPSRHSTTVSSSFDICLPTFRRCFSYPSKAWRGKQPDSQGHDWLRGRVPYPDGAFHVLTDQGVLHDEGEAQGLDTPARA